MQSGARVTGARNRGKQSRNKPPEAAKSRSEIIADLLSKIEQQLDPQTTKVTLADFIRLIQLQRELEREEQPAEVIVTWKDLSEKQDAVK